MAHILQSRKIPSFLASNAVALGAGSLYMYSLYAPQLIEKCHIPSSEASNLAFYLSFGSSLLGCVAGQIVDRSPNLSCLIGAICIGSAYYILQVIYYKEKASSSLIAFALSLLGYGAVSGYYAALKCCNVNFANNRGTAVAFPVSMYALSGMLFAAICTTFFKDDLKIMFRFMGIICPFLLILGFLFMKLEPVPFDVRPTISPIRTSNAAQNSHLRASSASTLGVSSNNYEDINSATLLRGSKKNEEDGNENAVEQTIDGNFGLNFEDQNSKSILEGLKSYEFIGFFIVLNILQGMGQMYIYSVGTITQTQFAVLEESDVILISDKIKHVQSVQVSMISLLSFFGRLTAGPLSDIFVKLFNSQRMWNVVISCIIMFVACLKLIYEDPKQLQAASHDMNSFIHLLSFHLSFTSSLFGYAFGMMFGTFPVIIADSFGTKNYSMFWALITMGGLLTVRLYTSMLSKNISSNTLLNDTVCKKGELCYDSTFWYMSISALIAGVVSILLIIKKYVDSKRTSNKYGYISNS
ncbi:hypothetical protein TBLA_0B05700 [Henningerozyma blattae CBS 6284]|uniref:Uncharacterized protein n=1 Tax=Henningerozyma blattae (strain ATCC 34711 / CBS 6284 / DSM 70876 / NBRC 10599 / NRRL Y-10934 / UCD 77-7) TaxID=1071380 RepID=I2GZ45_HENB6|nr:hypothetical protein TBLA_0B05700 [Tetrapisispora blattae CBS 6284]CCH59397.1 hypothetical protein TBLA_0B05700 [Tetrapisispora blattae CBS 6284]